MNPVFSGDTHAVSSKLETGRHNCNVTLGASMSLEWRLYYDSGDRVNLRCSLAIEAVVRRWQPEPWTSSQKSELPRRDRADR